MLAALARQLTKQPPTKALTQRLYARSQLKSSQLVQPGQVFGQLRSARSRLTGASSWAQNPFSALPGAACAACQNGEQISRSTDAHHTTDVPADSKTQIAQDGDKR